MQRNLVLQTIARTGLNVKFSVDCLTGNGWDLERAVANFNQVKVGLRLFLLTTVGLLTFCLGNTGQGRIFMMRRKKGDGKASTKFAMTRCNGTQFYSIIPSSLTRLWDSLSSSIGLSNSRAFLLFELPLTSIIYLELPPSTPLNSPLTPM